jgi:3-hydroxyacyl-CoA dehydrogenase/enoyl-CoA hydratase/3-hydroxybutyryl-CoA epimerase
MPDKSMNVYTEEVMDELDAIIDQVVADDAVKGAVITSGKKDSFSGGADITMLKKMFDIIQNEKAKDPQKAVQMLFDGAGRMSKLVYRKLETCGKPWVSAINGTCMGGAFEMSARLPRPRRRRQKSGEDGAAGSQDRHLPGRRRHPARAAPDQPAGRAADDDAGLQPEAVARQGDGLIHDVVPPKKLIAAAKAMIAAGLESPVQPWDEKGFKLPGGKIYTPAGANLWPAASAICAARPT